ncbi:MAG: hypothetical protein B9S32_10440 [Verrucomicrobia bacterium Tous-C9LFEB]|nr:MAG: hypothetical protein B9S32_10440 [Verrucomicrobia bacterium Tous-C9LFEB]
MQTAFDLNAEQVNKIRPILSTGIAEVIQLRKESLRKISACRTKFLDQIATYLNPEQQEKIHKFQRKKDAELQKQLEY